MTTAKTAQKALTLLDQAETVLKDIDLRTLRHQPDEKAAIKDARTQLADARRALAFVAP